MIRRPLALASMLGLCLAATAAAQVPTDTPSPATAGVPVTAAAPGRALQATAPATVGPVLRSSAVTQAAAPRALPLAVADPLPQYVNKHQSAAMMVVGGAGLIVGAIIGGTPGTLVMVAGGVFGLFGLYYYLQ